MRRRAGHAVPGGVEEVRTGASITGGVAAIAQSCRDGVHREHLVWLGIFFVGR